MRRTIFRYGTEFVAAGAIALVLSMVGGVVGPDSFPGDDSSTTVTVTTIQPRVYSCAIYSQGINGVINLGLITDANPGGDDVNRTGTQTQVGLFGTGGGAKSQSADPDDQLYLYVRVTVSSGDLDTGGIKELVNVTVKGWFSDLEVAGSDGTFSGFNSTPGKNTNFEANYYGEKATSAANTSLMFWPQGSTHSPNGSFPEVGFRQLVGGSVLSSTNYTDTVNVISNKNTLKIGIPIAFNNNVRWAKNGTGLESWKFRCLAGMKASAGESNTPDVYTSHFSRMRDEFGTFKHSKFAIVGSFAGTFAAGGDEAAFPADPQQAMYYYSNAPYNLSVNISNLQQVPLDNAQVGCLEGPICIKARSLGIDVGQMAAVAGAGLEKNCNVFSCWRFFYDNDTPPASVARFDGHIWVRGGNGTGNGIDFSDLGPGALDAGAYIARWLNNTCGSEEWDPDTDATCAAGSGVFVNEDTLASWYAQIPLGTLEGSYTTKITYRLRTHPNPTPRQPWDDVGGDQS